MTPSFLQRSRSMSFLLVVVTIVAGDLATKALADWGLEPNKVDELAPFLNLRLGHNAGISFGLMQATSMAGFLALVAFAFLASVLIVALGLRSSSSTERYGLALIAGGALGNVIDRAWDGVVTDFLDVHAMGWHWPAFNIADIAISMGALALIISMVFDRKESGTTLA